MNTQRNKNWNEQLVTEEVRSWHESAKPLYSHYMRQNYQELLAAGIRYFGTWRTAIEAAGIPYDSVRKYRDWSKERIIETIQRLEKDGVDLSFRSMMLSKYAPMVYAAIRPNHFGSWKDALIGTAGLAPEEIYRYRSWDDNSILTEIRRLKEEGADLSSKKMDETSNPLIATARRRFGNWVRRRSRMRWGLITRRDPPPLPWTRELILSEIRELRAAKADLRSGEIRHQHAAAPRVFAAAVCKTRFFGSWTKALQAPPRNAATAV